jgi:hypothetical protein
VLSEVVAVEAPDFVVLEVDRHTLQWDLSAEHIGNYSDHPDRSDTPGLAEVLTADKEVAVGEGPAGNRIAAVDYSDAHNRPQERHEPPVHEHR